MPWILLMLALGGEPIAAVAVADFEACTQLLDTATDAPDVVEAACIPTSARALG
jgi:hypothetical protein